MTQEDKDLLLKDLCARLPYGVKLQKTYDTSDPIEIYSIDLVHHTIKFYKYKGEHLTICDVGDIERFGKLRYKPYLFPLESMTEEQKKKYYLLCNRIIVDTEFGDAYESIYCDTYQSIDYLLENHFDYRGIIKKGLAIDATGLNIY